MVEFNLDHDITGWDVNISIGVENSPQLVINNPEVIPTEGGCKVRTTLTQAQTLAMPTGVAYVQLRAADGVRAASTPMYRVVVTGVVNNEEMGD